MATHSSSLAWRIPWTEEPGGLESIGSQRVRHNLKQLSMHTSLEDVPAANLSRLWVYNAVMEASEEAKTVSGDCTEKERVKGTGNEVSTKKGSWTG